MNTRTIISCLAIALSASCGDLVEPDPLSGAAPRGVHTRTLGTLSAEVYVGADSPADGYGRPALVILHGCSQSASDISGGSDLQAVADDFDAGGGDFDRSVGMHVSVELFVHFGVAAGVIAVIGAGDVDRCFDAAIAQIE